MLNLLKMLDSLHAILGEIIRSKVTFEMKNRLIVNKYIQYEAVSPIFQFAADYKQI